MKKVIVIILISAIAFIGGSLVAYYNISSLIYNDVNIFTIYEDGFKIMNFRFVFK